MGSPYTSVLLAYRSSAHETTGPTPACILFGRKVWLPCDLKCGSKPVEDIAGEDYVSDPKRRLANIHDEVCSHMQIASDRIKETYSIRASKSCYQPGGLVSPYSAQRQRASAILRKPICCHEEDKCRLSLYAGNNKEEIEVNSATHDEIDFEKLMGKCVQLRRGKGIVEDEPRDLFSVPTDYFLECYIARDLKHKKEIYSL